MDSRYGLATADLNGDGYLEIITGGYGVAPEIWDNPCGSNAWLQIRFEGPPGNTQGYGAVVNVSSDGRTQQQALHGLRTVAQSPASLHFGLGTAEQATVHVLWPDGQTASIDITELQRQITVFHPYSNVEHD